MLQGGRPFRITASACLRIGSNTELVRRLCGCFRQAMITDLPVNNLALRRISATCRRRRRSLWILSTCIGAPQSRLPQPSGADRSCDGRLGVSITADDFTMDDLLCRGAAICPRVLRHRRVHLGPSIRDAVSLALMHRSMLHFPRCTLRFIDARVAVRTAPTIFCRLVCRRKGCEAHRTLSTPTMGICSYGTRAV